MNLRDIPQAAAALLRRETPAAPAVPLAHTLRGLATLLAYPDAEQRLAIPSLRAWVDADERLAADRAGLHALLDAIEGPGGDDVDAVLDAEASYVDTFDRGRSTSLNLFEHVHGDSRDRGQAMVDLLRMYEKAGVELQASDLPDHLPAFLEYASLIDEAEARKSLADIVHILEDIGSALARRRSAYAAVFLPLLRLAGERDPASRIRPEAIEDDGTPAAIDRAWAEEPVKFGAMTATEAAAAMGGCGSRASAPAQHTIQIIRRKQS